jgi:hypothetical protein
MRSQLLRVHYRDVESTTLLPSSLGLRSAKLLLELLLLEDAERVRYLGLRGGLVLADRCRELDECRRESAVLTNIEGIAASEQAD